MTTTANAFFLSVSLEDMSLYFAEVTNDDTLLQVEAEMVQKRQAPDGSSARTSRPFSQNEVV